MKSQEIIIENFKCPSWNIFYAGVHWTKRKKIVDEIHTLVWAECKKHKIKKVVAPIKIAFEVSFKSKRRHDPDNIFCKGFLDGLVLAGVIEDDNSEIVKEVAIRVFTGMSDKVVITLSQI